MLTRFRHWLNLQNQLIMLFIWIYCLGDIGISFLNALFLGRY